MCPFFFLWLDPNYENERVVDDYRGRERGTMAKKGYDCVLVSFGSTL